MVSNGRPTISSEKGVGKILHSFIQRSLSTTFQRTFAIILVAEAVTICTAWLLLGSNASRWIHDKAVHLVQISQVAADGRDWSLVGIAPMKSGNRLFASYRQTLKKLSTHYFSNNEGAFFVSVIEGREEYVLTQSDNASDPMFDNGKADQWELRAYSSGRPTHTDAPYTDESGTSLIAYTPILRNGKVVGLVGVEVDSATVADLLEIVRNTFWLSMAPAILISLVVAYMLASMFSQPTDVLREIEETAHIQRARTPEDEKNDPWYQLTPKEKQIADLLRQGQEHTRDLAEALSVTPETIKQHLKNIKGRTGWSKQRLAVEAAARRSAALPQSA
jgi:DNA-binding CsgD family transcriptional regulator